jgi:hypothetical protein
MSEFQEASKLKNKFEKQATRLKEEKKQMLDVYTANEGKMREYEKLLSESEIPEINSLAENLTEIRHEFKMVFEAI